jgi:hypothetical protein
MACFKSSVLAITGKIHEEEPNPSPQAKREAKKLLEEAASKTDPDSGLRTLIPIFEFWPPAGLPDNNVFIGKRLTPLYYRGKNTTRRHIHAAS